MNSSAAVLDSAVDATAQEWRDHAAQLAEWTDSHMVARRDARGNYLSVSQRKGKQIAITVKGDLTHAIIARHYLGLDPGDIIGLHSAAPDNLCRSITIDIDKKRNDNAKLEVNEAAAMRWLEKLRNLGFRPWLEDSNGIGGFHLTVIFAEPVATAVAYHFCKWIVADWKEIGLAVCPEVFPKQSHIGKDEYGNWMRLPGRHHTEDHWSRFWNGTKWLDGASACEMILSTAGDEITLIPDKALPPDPEDVIPQQTAVVPEVGKPAADRLSDIEIAERCIRHIPNPDLHYDDWLPVLAALHSVDSNGRMYAAGQGWSAKSTKHHQQKFDSTWKSFRRSAGNVATIATLVHLAKQNGFDVYKERAQELRDKNRTASPGNSPARPKIILGTDEHRVADEAVAALAGDSTIFQRGGVLARVVRSEDAAGGINREIGAPTIATAPLAFIRDRITANAKLFQINREGEQKPAHPPFYLAQAVAARGEWRGIRTLRAISDIPILRPDGTIHQTPGYDPPTSILFDPSSAFPPIPDVLTQAIAIAAAGRLLDIVSDFPFEKPEHRSAWLAGLLTILARPAFRGPAPLFLADANVRGAGKTLACQIPALIATGRCAAVLNYDHDAGEFGKRITTIALAGDPIVLIDNIAGPFGNASLDAALTAERWTARILGTNTRVDVPLLAVWFASANNAAIAADISRRVIHIRLDVLEEKPEERSGFKHPDLLAWVRQNRPALLVDGLTILAAYCRAGRPDQGLTPFGSFEDWSALVRSAIVWCGLPDPCATRAELAAIADSSTDALRQLIEAWQQYDPESKGLVIAELVGKLYPTQYQPMDANAVAMRAALEAIAGLPAGKTPSARSIGNRLRAIRRRVMDSAYLDIDKGYRSRSGATWRIFSVKSGVTQ